jgi:hypothetical protein
MSQMNKPSNGRKQFDAIDMLRQAAGLPTPAGYAVITRQFATWLIEELERLYELEDVLDSVEIPEP